MKLKDEDLPLPLPTTHSDSRLDRRKLLVLAGAGASLGGLGLALWLRHVNSTSPPLPVDAPVQGFWDMQWESPTGIKLHMSQFRSKPLLINFWATWCAPCIEELPLINDFYRENAPKGWQVIGLALDKLTPVQSFMRVHPIDFPVGMAGLAGAELGRSLGNMGGSLPFSVVIGAAGGVLARKMGRLSTEDLRVWSQLK